MITVQVGQVWRDNLADCRVTVTDVIAPATIAVSYPNGHAACFAAGYFNQPGQLGFTAIPGESAAGVAITDRRFGGGT